MICPRTLRAAAERSPGVPVLPGWLVAGLLGLAAVSCAATDGAAGDQATIARLASRALLLDAAQAGGRIVAVGERGHILISTDNAVTWRQVAVPSRSTLTGVASADAGLLLAVGHRGALLRSSDSGDSWERVEAGVTGE
ncbi:MAG TPA: hypothetical protein VIK52_07070, partial [Opitutaceae bacterium]